MPGSCTLNPGMPEHLEFDHWVAFPVERVFEFFSNPENLERIMPASTNTRVESVRRVPPPIGAKPGNQKAAGVGSVILTSFRVVPCLPIRTRWIARITEFEWDRHFADTQEKGPFQRWHHRHEFLPESIAGVRGTRIRDIIDYEVGFGFLGVIAEKLFIAREMRRTFTGRQQVLPGLLESLP
jgi:ligand-binding SRPBCC domain-containing protein